MKKKLFSILVLSLFTSMCVACGGAGEATSEESQVLNLAYQYGLAYAPVVLCEQKGYIEEAYKEKTGKELTVVWNQMSSGADINTSIASGSIDAGFMGVAPAVTGVTSGVGYKIFTGLSGQEHGLMTNDSAIKSLNDIVGSDKQIALVNIGSIQHIILAKALTDNGLDAHALDSNIVAMKHPDGMSSLETGSISCHLTSNPYIYKERENDSLIELSEVKDSWSTDKSFIVGVASESFYSGNKEIYDALNSGIEKAINDINSDNKSAAELLCDFDGNTAEDEEKYLSLGKYDKKTKGIFELATFMYDNQFIDNSVQSYEDLVFDGVEGD